MQKCGTLNICSWNISKGLLRKLSDSNFVNLVNKYDILRLNECWLKCPDEFELKGYVHKYLFRKKCNGGGVVVFYKKWLNPYISIVKCCSDSMIWFKIDKSILFSEFDLYVCAIYMPPDRNIYYRKYNVDVFDVLQENIEHFSAYGTVSVIGDLNGRVGQDADFIVNDVLNNELRDNISFIGYINDTDLFDRQSEDDKPPNAFGRRILELCKSSGLRICNGRFGADSRKITFNNKNGSSVIDYLLYTQSEMFKSIKSFNVEPFNTFSCHAPIVVELYLKGNSIIKGQYNCSKYKYNKFKWNEGSEGDIRRQLIANAQTFDLLLNFNENCDVDICVKNLNELLTEVYEQYTKTEVTLNERCDFCAENSTIYNAKPDKPWFTEECKILYRQYQTMLQSFNIYRSNENRLNLNLAKQRYKSLKSKMKIQNKEPTKKICFRR